jgi:signal recognition particle receptor subunit beta
MASVNPHTRELVFKLVFYGPGLGGKTTTLQYIHATARPEHRGKMVSLATPTDRTLYFDFLPLRMPKVRGMHVRLQLFTVPGQVYYAATRKLVLSGADGVVFVADSQASRADVNQEALDDLHSNLAEHNRELSLVPHTFHWNKRDLSDAMSTDELERRFNKFDAPSLGTVATTGEGVFEGLERITRLAMRKYEGDEDPASHRLVDAGVAEAMKAIVDPKAEGAAVSSKPVQVSVPTGMIVVDPPSVSPPADAPEPRASAAAPAPAPVPAPGPARSGSVVPQQPAGASQAPLLAAVSFVEVWGDVERETARQVEGMLAAHDAVNAILATDVLVTRVLASAAAFVGSFDAPRDPAVVALLLGLEGRRYFWFRGQVRAARHREPLQLRDALECYAFAIETRRVRDALRGRT